MNLDEFRRSEGAAGMKRENEIFETMPVRQAYIKLALPVVISMVVSLIYNMMDTYFVAMTKDVNLIAGVSLGAPIFTLMIALGDILGLGGSSLISRLFGQQNNEDGKRVSAFCFYGAIVEGILVTALLLLFRTPILTVLGTSADTLTHTSNYYTYIALGAPFIILSFTPSNHLRSEGLAQESMFGSVLGAIVNMILDPILILVLGMGAAGAAIATVIGYVATDLFFVYVLTTKSQKLSLKIKDVHVSGAELTSVLAIGIPASITNLMQSIGVVLTNRFLLPYGNDKIAAMGIVMKVNMIAILILVGFAFGGQALVGYNYGSGNRKRYLEICRFAYKLEAVIALALSGSLILAARPVLSIFLKDSSMIGIAVPMLRLQLVSMICVSAVLVTTSICQAVGAAKAAFILSVCRQGVLYAVVIFLASKMVGYYGVLASQAISDLLTAAIAIYIYTKILSTGAELK